MHAPTLTAVVVLPTPPFWFATAYTVPIAVEASAARGQTPALSALGAPRWPSRPRGSPQRASVGHARPPREARRSRSHLPVEVKMAGCRAGKWLGPAGLHPGPGELLRR